jgi:FemAB family protein
MIWRQWTMAESAFHDGGFRDALRASLDSVELKGSFRQSGDSDWEGVATRIAYLPVDYSPAMMDYQVCYWNGNARPTSDLSLVLHNDNRPCALWPLSVSRGEGGVLQIGSSGGALRPPLFVAELAAKTVKTVTTKCLGALNHFCTSSGIASWESAESFADATGLSDWHDKAMQLGATARLRHELFIDLTRSMTEIKAGFRKSYKALITSGGKLWNVHLLAQADAAVWEEFRCLHLAVAGRATRSLESWDAQHAAIAAGAAFFVYLRDATGRMVGGGLFHVTRDEGEYAVGAYDRSLFDKPLGHVVQYHAIEEMKRRHMRWYKLGPRFYPSDVPRPTQKELSIADFKQGFASHMFPTVCVSHRCEWLLPMQAANK